jgi:hypothetical protein
LKIKVQLLRKCHFAPSSRRNSVHGSEESWRELTSMCHIIQLECRERIGRDIEIPDAPPTNLQTDTQEKAVMKRSMQSQTEVSNKRLGWSRPLARPVALRGGSSLVTLADVRSFLFKRLRADRQESANWQRVTALLLSAARSDQVDVADVTIAVEMAASMDEGPPKPEPTRTGRPGAIKPPRAAPPA